ncbi:MAG: hypothetical protein U1F64_13385 [Burkholderiales bacterium]
MTFDAFIESAWNDHGDRPAEVADRIAASTGLVATADRIAPYARLATHVFGEHLGEWERGVRLLESLRALPAYDASPAAEGAIARGIGALRYAEGDAHAVDTLALDDRIAAIAIASAALAGRGEHGRAIAALEGALALAESGLPDGSPALRALAVAGNNLACVLEEKADRDAAQTRGMVAAAEAALSYWKRAGTWLEEERAHYRLARSLLCAGRPRDAAASARRCLDVCVAHEAPAFERFFGHAALAAALRASDDAAAFEAARHDALDCYEEVPADERRWCAGDLAAIS